MTEYDHWLLEGDGGPYDDEEQEPEPDIEIEDDPDEGRDYDGDDRNQFIF